MLRIALARTLEQIMAELDPGYTGSRDSINKQIGGLGGQKANDIKQLESTKVDAYRNIDDTAASRGVLYGGVPAIEQSQYLKNTFTPAYSNIQSTYANKQLSLEEALNSLNRDQRTNASNLYQQEQQREQQRQQWEAEMAEQRRQFDEQQKAARAAAASSGIGQYLGGGGGGAQTPTQTNSSGFRSLLSAEAAKGNQDAALALKYVGNDGNYWIDFKNPKNRVEDWNRIRKALDSVGAKNAWRG